MARVEECSAVDFDDSLVWECKEDFLDF